MLASLREKLLAIALSAACCAAGCARSKIDSKTLDEKLLGAVQNADAAQVQQLLKKGAKVGAKDQSGDTALANAALEGNVAIVSLLLKTSIDTKNLNDALFWAASNEPLVVVSASVKIITSQPSHFRSMDDNFTDVAKMLLDKGTEVEARGTDGTTPLILAAGHGETGVVKLLLDRGAKAGDRDNHGATALHAAACECSAIDQPETLDSIRLLLNRGAEIEAKENDGTTPLIDAAGWGRTEIIELLLQRHAKIEGKNNEGNTALMVSAAGSGLPSAEAVQFLLDHGSKIEARNNEGNSALMLAAAGNGSEQVRIVKLLLSRGAQIQAKDNHGNTALSLAQKSKEPDMDGNRHKVLALLKSAMAASH